MKSLRNIVITGATSPLALEFIRWFKINKYTQYEYLTTFLDNKLALHQTLLQKNCELLTTLKVIPVRIKP